MEPSNTRKKRACVIGLDGVPIDLLRKLAENGVMPAMHRLIREGHLHRMKASLPEVSSVSWSSFMTGSNPGTHGIFGFTDLREHSYQVRFPNFLDLKAPTIWDRLGEAGFKSIVINQPSTYPARKIEGALVSGFVAIELAKSVYPLSHLAALEKMGYQTDIDTQKARQDHAILWKELNSTLEGSRKALRYFWAQEWDLFEFIVTGTDRLQHYLWDACVNPDHPSRAPFLDYYRQVDGLIDCISRDFQELTGGIRGLYLLSDHGFTSIIQEVHLNAWMVQAGYLAFEGQAGGRLADMAPGTRAFVLDPNRIYLNLKGRFPRGVVDKSEKQSLKSEISAALKKLEFEGRRVVREVFDTDEIYSGPHVGKGPDLVVLSEAGFDLKGSLGKKEVFGKTDLQGMHTWDDAFFWSARDCGPDLVISDLAALLLEEFE
jgi:predicted AlkP superfamily phosphohydrolase/phosphomutase